jgi:hypothetical protein
MAGWAPNARAVRGKGPVAVVEHQGLWRHVEVIAGDGAVRVEELVGNVGEDRGAAGGDATFGDQDEKTSEELADMHSGVEFGEFGE